MRVYQGSPRQEYEEVLRSMGAFLDQRGMREILIAETSDGFVVQGLAPTVADGRWSETSITLRKETFVFLEDDVARFMEEAYGMRRQGRPSRDVVPDAYYENALRVLGRYFDQQNPRDVFLFEHERSFVVRLLMAARTGVRHVLAEFTREEMEGMIAGSAELRGRPRTARPPLVPPPLPPTGQSRPPEDPRARTTPA